MHVNRECYAIRLFLETYEYKHKLIYKSLSAVAYRNFYTTLLPEQRKPQPLLLTVASKAKMLGDASCVAAGRERSRAGIQPCWQECQAPQAFGIFLHTKAQMFKVFSCKGNCRCGTCACKYPTCEHNWNYAGIIQVCSTSILLGNLSSGALLCCYFVVLLCDTGVEERQSHTRQISKALKKVACFTAVINTWEPWNKIRQHEYSFIILSLTSRTDCQGIWQTPDPPLLLLTVTEIHVSFWDDLAEGTGVTSPHWTKISLLSLVVVSTSSFSVKFKTSNT